MDATIKKKENSFSFTEGGIVGPLIRFALPLLAAQILQTAYGAVDLMVVGHFASSDQVSAVSSGTWVTQLFTVFILGLSMGTTVLLGNHIGAKEPEEAGKTTGASLVLFGLIGLIVTLLMTTLAGPITGLLKVPAASLSACKSYIRICGAGFLCIAAYNLLGAIFRGIGDSKIPFISVAVSCLLNIGGDLFLVAVLHMGAVGAAIATVLSQLVSVFISLIIIRRRRLPFRLSPSMIRWDRQTIRQVLRLGIPLAASDTLVNVSFLIITAIVNRLGVTASAAAGVAQRLTGFFMLMPSAFSQALAAFCAQNIGARKPDRARRAMADAMILCFLIELVMFFIVLTQGRALSRLFTSDPQVISASADYIRAYSLDCLLTSFMMCLIGYYNGLGKTTFVMLQGLAGAFLGRIPFALIMNHFFPGNLFYLGLSTPFSSLIQLILCLIYYLYLRKKEKKDTAASSR